MLAAPAPSITTPEFEYLQRLVLDHAAVVLDAGKEWLAEHRLLAIAEKEGAGTVSRLVVRLKGQAFSPLHRRVVEGLLTNETSFFRDFHPFEGLRLHVIPALLSRRAQGSKLRFWSAACASGQEPYSLAMLLREHFPACPASILATDLSADMIERARRGVYNQVEVNRGLPAALLVKHFEKRGALWTISEQVRRMVELREINLAREWRGIPRADVIFLRNVLIYFDIETRRRILGQIQRHLAPEGYLFLGGAETTIHLDSSFVPLRIGKMACYQLRG